MIQQDILELGNRNRSANRRVQCQPAAGTYQRGNQIEERGDCITDGSGRGRHADRRANLRGGRTEWSRE